jgi:hypothetical protein
LLRLGDSNIGEERTICPQVPGELFFLSCFPQPLFDLSQVLPLVLKHPAHHFLGCVDEFFQTTHPEYPRLTGVIV